MNNDDIDKVLLNIISPDKIVELKKDDLNFLKILIKKVEDDLKLSEMAYNSKIYTLSTYHLQQACEKIIKVHSVFYNRLNINKLKSIGHSSPKAFFLMAKDINISNVNEKLLNDDKKLDISIIKKSESALKKIKRGGMVDFQRKLVHIPYEDIENTISTLDKFKINLIETLSSMSVSDLIKKNKTIKFHKIVDDLKLFRSLNKIKDDLIIKHIDLDVFLNHMFDYYLLYHLSIFTFLHANTTRYGDDDIIKDEEYNEDLGIVKANAHIREILGNILLKVKNDVIEFDKNN